MAWDRNSESDLAGYRIYYGTASRVYNWFIDVGNVTTYTITGLTDGSTYYFAATAYDKTKKESTYSSEVTYNSCTFSISPTSASVGQPGGTGTIQVSTQTGCRWTAKSGASWFTITSGRQGTGSGNVSYSVSSNSSSNSRTVASTIAGRVFTVSQAGVGTTYTIKASAGNGGSISPSGTTVLSQGATKTFTITPNTGYKVSDVRVDGSSVGAVTRYTFDSVKSNHTISASFTANSSTYTVTAYVGNGGSISPSGTTVLSQGATKTFTITPNTGYKVSDILIDGSSIGAATRYTFRNIQANHTISAKFSGSDQTADSEKTNTFIIRVSKVSKNNGDGVVTTWDRNISCGESCTYDYKQNSTVTFVARANTGSTFGGWKPSSLDCSTDTCSVPVDKAKRIKAVFVGNYTLEIINISKDGGRGRVTSSPWSMDCVTGSPDRCEATYSYQKEVTLTAYPSSGSSFVGWSPATLCPGTGTCVVPMDRQRTIKAVFSKP